MSSERLVFWPCLTACGILVPWPGIEPRPLAVKSLSPNHWNAREFPHSKRLMCVCGSRQSVTGIPHYRPPGQQNHYNLILNFPRKVSLKIEMSENATSVLNVYCSIFMNTTNRKQKWWDLMKHFMATRKQLAFLFLSWILQCFTKGHKESAFQTG